MTIKKIQKIAPFLTTNQTQKADPSQSIRSAQYVFTKHMFTCLSKLFSTFLLDGNLHMQMKYLVCCIITGILMKPGQ